ncbi:MAG: NAD(P)H-binding protein [Ectothiorhodospira sp.]
MARITIAGASGFIGTALCHELAGDHQVTALTRSRARAATPDPDTRITWRHCDLFSQPDVTRTLKGCDCAIYLIHSLAPSSRLTQATPRDMDLILADNFARAAAANGVRQIVFVSGLIPESFRISRLLWSRREVEMVLGAHGVPVTVLRAGLVVGPGGSATRLMVDLVRRMGVLILPPTARSVTRPIALRDLNRAIRYCLKHPETCQGPFEIGGPEWLSYGTMLRQTARVLGLRRLVIPLPWMPEPLAALGVRWITGAPAELVGPIVASLPRDTRIRHNPVQEHIDPQALPFDQALDAAVDHAHQRLRPSPRQPIRREVAAELRQDSLVRSIQRILQPPGQDAAWVAGNYFRWLGSCCWPLVRTRLQEDGRIHVDLAWPGLRLLTLRHAPDESGPQRQVFHLVGGILFRSGPGRPRFEFQSVLDGRYTLAAIHDYAPALPWPVYRWTQAVVHLLVMRRYQHKLARLAR